MNLKTLAALALGGLLTLAAPVLAQEAPKEEGPALWKYLASLPKEQRLAVLAREAKREGGFTIYGALGIDRAQILNRIFNERYPDVKVNFVRLTEADLADKVMLEHRTQNVNSDLCLSTVAWMDLLKDALAPYEPTNWNGFDPRFRLGSLKDGWTAIVYELLPSTISWRTDRIKSSEAPKTLKEVANPKWAGRVGTTTHLENFINGVLGAMGEEPGMALLKKLGAEKPRLYRSTAALSQGIAAGEIDLAYDFSAHRPVGLQKKGAPIDWVFQDPLFGIGITFSVVKGAKHPYAAALYMDYLTQTKPQEALDKTEGGRFFGDIKGKFQNDLAKYPQLKLYTPIPTDRFKQLHRVAEDLFIRQ